MTDEKYHTQLVRRVTDSSLPAIIASRYLPANIREGNPGVESFVVVPAYMHPNVILDANGKPFMTTDELVNSVVYYPAGSAEFDLHTGRVEA